MRWIVVGLLLLSGCGPTRYQMDQMAMEQARAAAEARNAGYKRAQETAKAAVASCQEKRLKGEIKGFVGAYRCSNQMILGAYRSANWPFMDLINLREAARLSGAEKIDSGQLTEADVQLQIAELDVRVSNEIRRRLNEAQQLATQRASAQAHAAAAQAQADAASTAATGALLQGLSAFQASSGPQPIPGAPIITNCQQLGSFTNCTTL